MITLLASITGFISSIMPEVLKYFKDINDKKHELQILSYQMEFSKVRNMHSIEEINISRDIMEQNSLYSNFIPKIKWVDALNSSVRPILAYCFFIIYIVTKCIQYKAISHNPVFEIMNIIWSVDDQAIFASIISFYYGQRTFRSIWKNKF
ncbi:hypothetical protein [Rickettsia endosymbiont of Cardiosporidium cionae]|uniref:hypothetical protein n=1 Tax=Rickettsia endosymbiont of Cardiosporidium cionae TaxID=2777155 RepID=UPI001895EBDA|nr:hypothetical protein [Rickettsia endosymbiont of Cardiosporidium cionae]KAF8818423.1 hypothetical protein IHI24_000513 [Rickettsia endosymbiont of Cardiosporidium cionae]